MINNFFKILRNQTNTENGDPAYASTLNSCLDFFVTVVRDTDFPTIIQKFEDAFREDKIKALKILYNFRDCRHGKGEKKISYVILMYLKLCRYDAYKLVLKDLVELGCWKDLIVLCNATLCYGNPSKHNTFEYKLIVNQIRKDFERDKPSLLCKWMPMQQKKYHNVYLQLLNELNMKPKTYRKKMAALKNKLNLAETNLSNKGEENINFQHLPALCHHKYRKTFKRDTNAKDTKIERRCVLKLRYEKYLKDLSEGKQKIKFKGLQPHKLVKEYLNGKGIDLTVDAQWNEIIKDIRSLGTFKETLSIVDVSASMEGEPMEVAIALGLIVSQCTDAPFNDKVITFSKKPTFHSTENSSTLYDKVNSMRRMECMMNTDLHKVFQLILHTAKLAKLTRENMVKRLFIFTDMQFDECIDMQLDSYIIRKNSMGIEGTLGKCKEMFEMNGYTFPDIVCWNLRSSSSVPYTILHENVCMLSGFSQELLKSILSGTDFSPLSIMNETLIKYSDYFRTVIPSKDLKDKPSEHNVECSKIKV